MRRCLFLDRDGVVNRERGEYTFLPEHFEILPHLPESIFEAREKGYLIIIISNQGGVAKGLYGKTNVVYLHQLLLEELERYGTTVDEFYFCPHHDAQGRCLCRKPGSQMIEKAIARYGIDPSRSFMIGDSVRDVEAAERVGVKGIRIAPNSSILDIVKGLP